MENDEKRDLSMSARYLRPWVPLIVGPVVTECQVCVSGARGSIKGYNICRPATNKSLSIIKR